MDGLAVHLEGETNSFDSVEKIKQAFAANQLFQGVSVTDTRVGATPSQVVFRLTLHGATAMMATLQERWRHLASRERHYRGDRRGRCPGQSVVFARR